MTTISDSFGRSVTVTIDQDGEDIYALDGFSVAFPTGTPEAQAMSAVNAHAPEGYVPPQTSWTFLQFMGLFTAAEQDAIFASSDTQTRMFITMAASAGANPGLQLANPEVAGGVAYLASINLIASGRPAQILAGAAPPSS